MSQKISASPSQIFEKKFGEGKLPILVFSVLVLCFLATLYIFAWTEPSVAPPGGNVAPPLNTSSTPQTKPARLTFAEFYDSNNNSYYVNPAGSSVLQNNLTVGGKVGIGIAASTPRLYVAGSIVNTGFDNLVVGSLTGLEIGYSPGSQAGIIRVGNAALALEPLGLQVSGVIIAGNTIFSPPTYQLEMVALQLGGTAGNTVNWQKISGNSGEGNMNQLRIFHNRYAAGTDWSSAEIKIQKTVGTTDMHYITFRGNSGWISSLNFGYGTMDQLTILQNGNVGIGRSPTANRLEVEGTASKTTAGSWLANSDIRIKTDIQDIGSALDVISMLRPVKFRYSEEYMAKHPSITDQYYYNFIAQDFQRVFPAFVQDDGEGYLQIDTYPVTPYLVAAVQELNKTVEQLKAENNELKKRIEILESR